MSSLLQIFPQKVSFVQETHLALAREFKMIIILKGSLVNTVDSLYKVGVRQWDLHLC